VRDAHAKSILSEKLSRVLLVQQEGCAMDLTTTYMGLKLRSPLIPSASPLSESIENIQHMEAAGAAAIVMHSLFEEQLQQECYELHHHLTYGTESFPEALTYFPELSHFRIGPEDYLKNVTSILPNSSQKPTGAIPIFITDSAG
jgi:dihydroorotate dehydrogenase